MSSAGLHTELLELMAAREGHFRYESGHHGRLWLDTERLFVRPARLRPHVEHLSAAIAKHDVRVICGPLVGGAFLAQMVAATLGARFCYSAPVLPDGRPRPPAPPYRVPGAFRDSMAGQRVAIVDDVINAASAVRATADDLRVCGAVTLAVGALLVLGPSAARFAAERSIALACNAHLPNEMWVPAECPVCRAGTALSV